MIARIACSLLVLLPALGHAAPARGPGAGDLPEAIPRLDELERGERPVWVAREVALGPDGEIRWELFGPDLPQMLDLQLRLRADRPDADPDELCITTVVSGGFKEHRRSMDSVVEHALAILRARVVARAEGFVDGYPANLLEIEVSDRIRLHPSFSSAATLYVVYPYGRFDFAGIPLCGTLGGFEPPPEIGEDLLLLAHQEPIDPEGRVIRPIVEGFFLEVGDGLAAAERLWDHDEIRRLPSLDALAELIRAKIEGDPEGKPFDREACTPPELRGRSPFEGLGPSDPSWTERRGSAACSQLLVIDLEGDLRPGIAGPEHAVRFDLDGDGSREATSWPYPTQALPWLDLNGNGRVDGGQELFSVRTQLPDGTVGPTAFEALAAYDTTALGGDGDGAIGPTDLVWEHLRLWIDHDRDGRSAQDEIYRPNDVCLARLSLDRERDLDERGNRRRDGQGHTIWSTSEALRRDSRGKPFVGSVIEISTRWWPGSPRPAGGSAAGS